MPFAKDRYYKTRKERHEYIGERYFRVNMDVDKIVQVCITNGDIKKGKSNTFGVYLIHKLTFFSNYAAMNYVEEITQKEYYKQFKKVFKALV